MEKVKATWCGTQAEGDREEYSSCTFKACAGDTDCVFAEWSEPGECSALCNGHRTRRRGIAINSTGQGMPCSGSSEKLERCHPSDGEDASLSCRVKPVGEKSDCHMSDWNAWRSCSTTCDLGYTSRHRSILAPPSNGGKRCHEDLEVTKSCHDGVSCFPNAVNCMWKDWTVWSACDVSYKKTRTRGISHHAVQGGLECTGDVSEITDCGSRQCIEEQHTCHWKVWSPWSQCSKKCGMGGVRERSRELQVTEHATGVGSFGAIKAFGIGDAFPQVFSNSSKGSAASLGLAAAGLLLAGFAVLFAQRACRVSRVQWNAQYGALPQGV